MGPPSPLLQAYEGHLAIASAPGAQGVGSWVGLREPQERQVDCPTGQVGGAESSRGVGGDRPLECPDTCSGWLDSGVGVLLAGLFLTMKHTQPSGMGTDVIISPQLNSHTFEGSSTALETQGTMVFQCKLQM